MFTLPEAASIDVRTFATMLDYNTQSASYKPLWLMGILEEIKKGNREISFKTIGCHMVSKVWYPILHCKLSFGYQDSLPRIVKSLNEKLKIKPDEKVNVIFKYLMDMDEKEILKEIKVLFEMVPYRLLSPFYKIIDKNFNKGMREQTAQDATAFYQFIEDGKSILIGKAWFNYMTANQVIIQAWIEYSFIYYLQKKNPNVPAIPLKLNPPDKRNLGDATKLWTYYGSCRPLKDIYINKNFSEGAMNEYGSLSIDHFLPWSFVLHDEIWNLLPSFKNINSSKNNDLPNLEIYWKDFCNLQYDLFSFMKDYKHSDKQKKLMNKLLEDYLHIMPANWDSERALKEVSPDKFKDCLQQTVTPLYQIAYNQGYGIWVCKNRVMYESTAREAEEHIYSMYVGETAEAREEIY